MPDQPKTPAGETAGPLGEAEARLGDRGDASGRNIRQNRAVGQHDPMEGSRQGRDAIGKTDYPGTPDIGTDAAQTEEAERMRRGKR
ncbi:hypothetical protein SRS16CHR_03051 [Variovorax sp. SRS16]|uniref:hypothetical protein n=1 Tax=Variovorax sp. SRS16 TaxID=282217 RepID=UPI001317E008|nr:hypothetical protein [Variovorax sp. SRS16]VTU22439.1 hypothetical protein SRS16CHR_03051 [Variovorax sp. SRS16]